MKIISLNIDGYKLFNPSPKIKLGKEINLLIGVNGSGKSTVLEAIAIIFAEVNRYCEDSKTRERKFNFTIEYSFIKSEILQTTSTTQSTSTSINHVLLTSSKESGLDYSMVVNESLLDSREEMMIYLPDNLIFYYAGFCDTLEGIVSEISKERANNLYRLRNQENIHTVINNISKSIIYIEKEYYPLLFLLHFIDESNPHIPLTGKPFQIHRIQFYLQKPEVSTSTDYKEFYNIKGFLRIYLDNLAISSQDIEEIIDDEKKHIGSVLTIEYHRSIFEVIEELPDIPENLRYDNSRYLAFHFITLLFHIGLLKEISVAIKDQDGEIYNINDFSEGEQQLITIDAINKVLCKGNTVLFFDEPDSYLHPHAQREILPYLIDKFINRFTNDYVQLITTTHSLFVAQSLDIENILLFTKNGKVRSFKEKLLSFVTISNNLFGIESEFTEEIETNLLRFQKLVKRILLNKKKVDNEFHTLKNKLIKYGEGVEIIVNFEIRKLLTEGKYNAENEQD